MRWTICWSCWIGCILCRWRHFLLGYSILVPHGLGRLLGYWRHKIGREILEIQTLVIPSNALLEVIDRSRQVLNTRHINVSALMSWPSQPRLSSCYLFITKGILCQLKIANSPFYSILQSTAVLAISFISFRMSQVSKSAFKGLGLCQPAQREFPLPPPLSLRLSWRYHG